MGGCTEVSASLARVSASLGSLALSTDWGLLDHHLQGFSSTIQYNIQQITSLSKTNKPINYIHHHRNKTKHFRSDQQEGSREIQYCKVEEHENQPDPANLSGFADHQANRLLIFLIVTIRLLCIKARTFALCGRVAHWIYGCLSFACCASGSLSWFVGGCLVVASPEP